MQIDFHHAVTYVCCRLAGMGAADARTVAHASQYVDDATDDGPVQFATGERYVRVTSAHQTMDLFKNRDAGDNRLVWVPFHFLPGNDASPPGTDPGEVFVRRMVCRPDSAVAQDMMQDCVARQHLPFALHRLGVALHTYVDTWAHQGFTGMICDFNKVDAIHLVALPSYQATRTFADLSSGTTRVKALLADLMPVGHAGVLTFPDLPFLQWSFKRANGEVVSRDNPVNYLVAATRMFNMVRRYVADDWTLPDEDLPTPDKLRMDQLLRTVVAIDGEDRHPLWLDALARGEFSFGPAPLDYVNIGPGSWKFQALGVDPDGETGEELFDMTSNFLTSDWKRFHDAVQFQRLFVLHELLPRHGICAA